VRLECSEFAQAVGDARERGRDDLIGSRPYGGNPRIFQHAGDVFVARENPAEKAPIPVDGGHSPHPVVHWVRIVERCRIQELESPNGRCRLPRFTHGLRAYLASRAVSHPSAPFR
jgi:hypothetical protein